MAHALIPSAAANPLFKTHPKMSVQKGAYTYTIETRDGQTTYSVTDGKETISAPVHWIFGANSQTYVLERNGYYYESLVSYWKTIDALDTTVGDQAIQPKNVARSVRPSVGYIGNHVCFGCHSSNSVSQHKMHLETLVPGITCAHCHAGAEEHLQAISQSKLTSVPPKIKQWSPEEISAFCGQCHRTWETVVRNHWTGPMNVRFQPYRLELSKCFDGIDKRMSCISCHDPHQEVVRDDKTYDSKCLACHSAGAKLSAGMVAAHPGATAMKVCPVSTTDCVSCHMPKRELPGGHGFFTDHDIRIARANDPYPH